MLVVLLTPLFVILLLLIPGVRLAVAWALTFVVSPVFLRTRYRFVERPDIMPDQRVWSPEAASIPRKAAELLELGFEHRGDWVFDRVDGLCVVRMEIYAHEPTRTIAAISQTTLDRATIRTVTEMVRIAGNRRVSVVDHALDRQRMRPGRVRIEAPSITRAAWMWRVIEALGARHGLPLGDPLPSTIEQWTEHLLRERAEELDRMRERGVLTRPGRRGASRFTIGACLRLTAEHLWPMKGRAHNAALVRERALLRELGLEAMLDEALQLPEAAAREKAAALPSGGGIPDDRGVPHPIASSKSLAGDDRRGDPRFAAVVGQSRSARMRHYKRTSVWVTVGLTLLAIVGAVIFRLPLGLAILGGLAGALLVNGLLNAGRYHASERAAAEMLIRHGLCPSCLYGLGGLTAEADGCLVCPECGGAWNRSRVRDFTAFGTRGTGEEGLVARARRVRTAMTRGSGVFVRDACGERRALVSPLLENEIAAVVGGESGDVGQRLRSAQATLRKSGRVRRWTWTIFVLALNLAPLAALFYVGGAAGGLIVPAAVGVSIGFVMTMLVLRPLVGIRKRTVIATMLGQRLCPSCADDLAELTPDREGIVTCMCGAAWRVAPPTVPAGAAVIPPAAPPPRSPATSSSCRASSD